MVIVVVFAYTIEALRFRL